MFSKKYHRLMGLIMLLPLGVWAITGALFITKPGWGSAYERLNVTTYPLEQQILLKEPKRWLEVRQLRTLIGAHLLVADQSGWRQLDPITQQPRPLPAADQLHALFSQAIAANSERYGSVERVNSNRATTSTGNDITLNWGELSLRQSGSDTQLISQLYKLHYLQWTGNNAIDKVLGVAGLLTLIMLTILGGWMSIGKNDKTPNTQSTTHD